MASVFKLRITRYVDSQGRRVAKDAPDARLKRERSTKWYGEYDDEHSIRRRVPLATDKTVAQSMLTGLVRQSERRRSGLVDPSEQQLKRPIAEHIQDYRDFLAAKEGTELHVAQSIRRIESAVAGGRFRRVTDIDAPKLANWLAEQRKTKKRFSHQTSNFYLDAMKYFCNWLVRHDRLPRNPLAALQRLNVDVDPRHHRRALSEGEFNRLVNAAEQGPNVQGMSGQDRAMLYIVSAWTGFRRTELSSLTRASLNLDAEFPSVCLNARRSKRRRVEELPLHSYVVDRLRSWLAAKPADESEDAPLFALRSSTGFLRDTAAMMRKDLASARSAWLDEAANAKERSEREKTDFLKYEDGGGLFADFHSNRHSFISSLSRGGVALAMAQKLARHSDPRLTSNRYTHLELKEKSAAMASLPTPPAHSPRPGVSTGAESLVAVPVAENADFASHALSQPDNESVRGPSAHETPKPLPLKEIGNGRRRLSRYVKVHPEGFEPPTLGSEDRCSIR